MNAFLILGLIIFIFLVLRFFKAKYQNEESDDIWPFYSKRLLSNPEQVLYFRLVQALPDHIIFAQVQLSRFLGVKKGHNFQYWYNRINRMSADFVICQKDASVLAVIELDDSTHSTFDRKAADAKKDKVLEDAGIRIIRWEARSIPDISTIQTTLLPSRSITVDDTFTSS